MLPLSGLRGVINPDIVGRLGAGKIAVHASGSADEWQHIFSAAPVLSPACRTSSRRR
ncbi:MAG: hypothetical protein R3F17_07215 [Planctomycetota bacterium]